MSFFIRYFKKELLPLGAIEEPHLPLCLISWIDKNSLLCMYTMFHIGIIRSSRPFLSLSLWTLSLKASRSSDLMVMTPLMILSLRSFQTQSFSH
jgi:hypothetical protein